MRNSKNLDFIHVESLRMCAANFVGPGDTQKTLKEFDSIANIVRGRHRFILFSALIISAIPSGFIDYYFGHLDGSALWVYSMLFLSLIIYAVFYFIFNFFIQYNLHFSDSFLARRIYKFDLPEKITAFFDQLKTEKIRVHSQWVKPYAHHEALRAICPESGKTVTLQHPLTGEAFNSRLLPLLLSSRRRDWGFCLIKTWGSLSRAPLYVEVENKFSPQKPSAEGARALPLPIKGFGHWRHDIHPHFRKVMCDNFNKHLGWIGEQARLLEILLMEVLSYQRPVKIHGGKEQITALVQIAIKELKHAKKRQEITAIWFDDKRDPDPAGSIAKLLGRGETGTWEEARVKALEETLELQSKSLKY